MAIDKVAEAARFRGIADVLDPPTSTPPVVPPPVTPPPVTPPPTNPPPSGGFAGRTDGDSSVWKSAVFAEDFPNECGNGAFAQTYKMWDVYPFGWFDTSKKGVYDPNNLSVVTRADGRRVLQQMVVPSAQARAYNDGRTTKKYPGGCVAQPKFGSNGVGQTTGERIQVCFKLEQQADGHYVPLGWVINDGDWPAWGEPDYIEIDTGNNPTIGGWFHVENGGENGEGQVELKSDVRAGDGFHVVTHERIPGKSYRWFVDGKLYKVILPPGGRAASGEESVTTVLSGNYNIPKHALRWPLQLETNGKDPAKPVLVHVDWMTIQELV